MSPTQTSSHFWQRKYQSFEPDGRNTSLTATVYSSDLLQGHSVIAMAHAWSSWDYSYAEPFLQPWPVWSRVPKV